jgi:hypothetical protein
MAARCAEIVILRVIFEVDDAAFVAVVLLSATAATAVAPGGGSLWL